MPKSYNNPLGLHLGQRIDALKFCSLYYDDDNVRKLHFHDINPNNTSCYITGCVKRALGTYIPGSRSWNPEDYCQAQLKVSKYIWLYEVRRQMHSFTFLVHPDHIDTGIPCLPLN